MSCDDWVDCPKCGGEECVGVYDHDFYELNADETISLVRLRATCQECGADWDETRIKKDEQ